MAVFRVERNTGYTVMSNHHLRNKELSLKAKGLLSQMLSLPEDWDYTLSGLSYINRESIDAIRTAVWELEKARLISRNPTKPLTDWIRQRQLSPKKRNLRKSAPLTKPPGKARPACTLRKRTSRPDLRTNTAPYPAPHRKPGFWYTTKSILSKRIIPAWRAHIRARKPPSAAQSTG